MIKHSAIFYNKRARVCLTMVTGTDHATLIIIIISNTSIALKSSGNPNSAAHQSKRG